jgi:heme/copper-type cytochrome/quinol oxidase subunit 2
MWSNIFTESSYQYNFNIGFSTLKSDVIIHLAQWQYWWWFWFSLVWSLYYFVILKTVRYRVLKMRPKISTSFRPHGKWGDFIACIIPLTWCINILVNSNLILRLIEWQNESSLFTVRVRSRQWYWIYKFELKSIIDIISTPKNIGYNKWRFDISSEFETSNNYLEIIQNRSNSSWVKNYWDKTIQTGPKNNKFNIITPQEQIRLQLEKLYNNTFKLTNNSSNFECDDLFINNYKYLNVKEQNSYYKIININSIADYNIMDYFKIRYIWKYPEDKAIHDIKIYPETIGLEALNQQNIINKDSILNSKINSNKISNQSSISKLFNNIIQDYNKNLIKINHDDFDEMNRWHRKSYGIISPLRFIKLQFNNLIKNDYELFKLRVNTKDNEYPVKVTSNNIYLSLKQKKYNRKKFINNQLISYKNKLGASLKTIKYKGKPYLDENKLIKQSNYDYTLLYKLLKKNKTKNELIPITLARRLLRTKATLVLPAHVNITIITNSYDIIHSWFIPGLGIKLDCVPGRSTHHTFYIDNVGFYYGQCAEICGRYHHHMPIRICALPFEHFLIWWSNYGLPKMLSTFKKKNYDSKYGLRRYSW